MPTKRIQQFIVELSFEKKLIGLGAALLVVSSFLPWYSDLDSFKTGDLYLGVTGPLYFAGFSLMLLAAANLAVLWMNVSGRKLPLGGFKYSSVHLSSGVFTFYMLMIVNSIYFHQEFGLNITMKQSQFGMFFAFIAASFLTIGGYLASRDKIALMKEFQDEAAENIMQPEQRKPKENLRVPANDPSPLMEPITLSQTAPQEPVAKKESSNYQHFRTDL